MSKPNKSRRQENEAFAIARHIRGGERKLNYLAQLIRGKPVDKALVDLQFSRRRMANDVKKVLESAIANAENNHGLDVDRLFVKSATVGRTITMRRFRPRARGRSSVIEKPFSNITIIVEERDAAALQKKAAKSPEKKETKDVKKEAAPKKKAEKTKKKAAPKKKTETKAKAEKKPAAKKKTTKKKAGDDAAPKGE